MPALLIFGPPVISNEGSRNDAVRLSEDAATAVQTLSEADTPYIEFHLHNDPSVSIWVNRESVRMVRES